MSTMSLQEIRDGMVRRHEADLAAVDRVIAMARGLTEGNGAGAVVYEERVSAPTKGKRRTSNVQRPTSNLERATGKQVNGLRIDPRSLPALKLAQDLPAEFGPEDMERVVKLTAKGTSGTLNRWKTRGWIERVGMGRYRRTVKWPPLGEEKRVHVPGLDDEEKRALTKEEVADKLRQALQERDSALARGNETLHRILQDKVNKLQKQFGAMA